MEKDNKIKSKIIQTYAEDMAKVIEGDQSGLVKKIIHEEEKHEIEKKNMSPQSKRNQIMLLFGLLFIILGVSTLFYFFLNKEAPSVPVKSQFTPIIYSEKSSTIDVTDLKKDQLEEKIRLAVNSISVKNGGIEGLYLTLDDNKIPVGFSKFLELIESSLIAGDSHFIYENFLLGGFKNDNQIRKNDFFILLKVRSIADIFDTFHLWEKKMFYDLHGFLGIDISPQTNYLLTTDFQDVIVGNKNARILYDNKGDIVIMYIFANADSVIITNTENAAREIMRRLSTSQIRK